jgi:hypothetical protein
MEHPHLMVFPELTLRQRSRADAILALLPSDRNPNREAGSDTAEWVPTDVPAQNVALLEQGFDFASEFRRSGNKQHACRIGGADNDRPQEEPK